MNHLNDDGAMFFTLEQDATDSITPSTMDGAQFLVGALIDNRCIKKTLAIETSLILLRTRGLASWGDRILTMIKYPVCKFDRSWGRHHCRGPWHARALCLRIWS